MAQIKMQEYLIFSDKLKFVFIRFVFSSSVPSVKSVSKNNCKAVQ